MSKHLGTSYRSIDSDHSCGWDLLVLSKDDLDFSGTSYFPACGTSKEIELLWDEVGRNGVMVHVPAGSCCSRAGQSPCSRSHGQERVDGMGAGPQMHPRDRSPPSLRRGLGHSIGSARKRGDPVTPCKYLVGEEGGSIVPTLQLAPF